MWDGQSNKRSKNDIQFTRTEVQILDSFHELIEGLMDELAGDYRLDEGIERAFMAARQIIRDKLRGTK